MSKRTFILFTLLFATMTILAQGSVRNDSIRKSVRERNRVKANKEVTPDTVPALYPVAETTPTGLGDIKQRPLDLRTPANIATDTLYNEKDGTYELSTRLGESTVLGAPILLESKSSVIRLSEAFPREVFSINIEIAITGQTIELK